METPVTLDTATPGETSALARVGTANAMDTIELRRERVAGGHCSGRARRWRGLDGPPLGAVVDEPAGSPRR